MSDEYPRFSTMYERRAYQRRLDAMEEHDDLVDQLRRLEGEIEDVIRSAGSLIEDGIDSGDMAEVITHAALAMAIVRKRRHIMKNTVGG